MMATPANENCLENVRCPNCGNSDKFIVTGMSSFVVTDDGAEQSGDIEYDATSPAQCNDCNFQAQWGDFEIPKPKVRYVLEVTFDADRILSAKELDCLAATVATEVQEPVVIDGPDKDWTPAEWESSNVKTEFKNVVIVNGQSEVRPIL